MPSFTRSTFWPLMSWPEYLALAPACSKQKHRPLSPRYSPSLRTGLIPLSFIKSAPVSGTTIRFRVGSSHRARPSSLHRRPLRSRPHPSSCGCPASLVYSSVILHILFVLFPAFGVLTDKPAVVRAKTIITIYSHHLRIFYSAHSVLHF